MGEASGLHVGDRYELLSRLGQGGMGTVWRAHDQLLDRDVAIKEVLVPEQLSESERRQRHARTIREARSAARLSHPGAVTVHDVVEHDGRPWIVMELVSAPSLQGVIDEEGPLPPRRVAGLGRQVLAALRAAHAAGIVHRDIKPSNVLVAAADHAVVTDFGIAALEGDATLTGTGVLIGSPAYIAPERARGERDGPEGDLWSLGATMYAAVEGRSPFERSGPVSTLAAIMGEDAAPPRNAGSLSPILAGLLRRDPAERMTAAEADRLLAQVEQGTQPDIAAWTIPVARPPEPPPPLPPAAPSVGASRGSTRAVVASALAGALLVTAFGAVWLLGRTSAGKGSAAATTPTAGTSSPAAPRTAEPGRSAPEDLKAASPAGGGAPAPEQWTTRSESGFSVSVPSSWSRRSQGDNVFYEDTSTRFMLQIGTTPWDADPESQARTVGASVSRTFPGYREASVTPTTYLGVPAADLRFAYDRSTGTERVIDRFFRVDGACFAIYFRMPAERWADSPRYLDPIFNGFHTT
jgi:tRNA A-37 threonylcarbamoyl transferase component Bud32